MPSQTPAASFKRDEPDTLTERAEENANLTLILKELREFRKDNEKQLNKICEDINSANKRIEEAEERIQAAETRLQSSEDLVGALFKHQIQLNTKLIDLESRSKRENIRIYGVKEGSEDEAQSVAMFVEQMLRENLKLPTTVEFRVERAHRALATRPPPDAPPRSISLIGKLPDEGRNIKKDTRRVSN